MKDRINTFIISENITPGEFADKIGVQRSSISHVLNGRNNPSFSFIQKILEVYPTINARWLMLGEGEMKRKTIKPEEDTMNLGHLATDSLDLFSTKIEMDEDSKQKEIPEEDDSEVVQTSPIATKQASITSKDMLKFNESKKVKKVLIFYTDHTFEEYSPAD